MSFTRRRPANSVPHQALEAPHPLWTDATPRTEDRSNWPPDLNAWNHASSQAAEGVIATLKARYARVPGSARWTSSLLLTRWGVDRAILCTRELYDGVVDHGAVAALVHDAAAHGRIDVAFIQSLARLLLGSQSGGPRMKPGAFRTTPSFVGSLGESYRETYRPVDIEASMHRLVALSRAAGASQNPLTQAAWLHMQTSFIHPFANGNGRVSRLLAAVTLLASGWPPVGYTLADNNAFYAVFAEHCPGAAPMRARAFTDAYARAHRDGLKRLADPAAAKAFVAELWM